MEQFLREVHRRLCGVAMGVCHCLAQRRLNKQMLLSWRSELEAVLKMVNEEIDKHGR